MNHLFLLVIGQASGAAGDGAPAQDPVSALIRMALPFALMFGVMYFMLIRPQSKKRKEHEAWLAGLKKGDSVITQGGVIGKITSVSDDVVTLDVGKDVKVRVLRSYIVAPESSIKKAMEARAAK